MNLLNEHKKQADWFLYETINDDLKRRFLQIAKFAKYISQKQRSNPVFSH